MLVLVGVIHASIKYYPNIKEYGHYRQLNHCKNMYSVDNPYRSGEAGENWARKAAKSLTYEPTPNAKNGPLLKDRSLPNYEILIQDEEFTKIRDQAMRFWCAGQSGSMLDPDKEIELGLVRHWHKAQFKFEDRIFDVKIKLRGGGPEHFGPDHYSLRVKFPGDDLFEGKRVINLIVPYDKRFFFADAVNAEVSSQGGTIYESSYAKLFVNETLWGVYLVTGNWRNDEYSSLPRSEGVIIRGTGKVESGDEPHRTHAVQHLRQLFLDRGKKGVKARSYKYVKERVDVSKAAGYMAWCELLAHKHMMDPSNIFYFFDPALGRLEPILYDIDFANVQGYYKFRGEFSIWDRIPEIRHLKNQYLYGLITERWDSICNRTLEELDKKYGEAFKLDNHYKSAIYSRLFNRNNKIVTTNAEVLKKELRQKKVAIAAQSLQNINKSDLQIERVAYRKPNTQDLVLHKFDPPIRLTGYEIAAKTGGYRDLQDIIGNEAKIEYVTGINCVTGDTLSTLDMVPTEKIEEGPISYHTLEPPETIELGHYDNIQQHGQQILFGPGTVDIADHIVIPKDYKVIFQPGLSLLFNDNSSIIIRGQFESKGTPELPVVISSKENSTQWGLAVFGEPQHKALVKMEHTIIKGGFGSKYGTVEFTSPFSIHDAHIKIRSSAFFGSRNIDGINFKYSTIDIKDSYFSSNKDADQDAVDLDFCTGPFSQNLIAGASGDGLDLSGSDVKVTKNTIRNVGDKGISIGERATAFIENCYISKASIGIAVKDGSRAEIHNTTITDATSGISSYKKKAYFNYPVAKVYNSLFVDVQTPGSIVNQSTLVFKNSAVRGEAGNIFAGLRSLNPGDHESEWGTEPLLFAENTAKDFSAAIS